MTDKVIEQFKTHFKGQANVYFAPGRVNLIGEHTDYNFGYVLPGAIRRGIYVALRPNNTNISRVYSINYDEAIDINFKAEMPKVQWAKYIYGVVSELNKLGHNILSFDAVFGGDIPLGAGLSSSAALEMAFALALNDSYHLELSREQLAIIGQKTENNYIGVNCGIMDQYASIFGHKDTLLQLDCRSLEHKFIPFDVIEHKVILINTMVKHSLASTEYNQRRMQCEMGVKILSSKIDGITSLRDIDRDMLNTYKDLLGATVYKRCLYVINENQRLLDGCEDLQRCDCNSFGEKLFASHQGLSVNYEVSCKELDFIVDIAKSTPGVIGARMMGGGFGGCVINIVETPALELYLDKVKSLYNKEFDIAPSTIEVMIKGGARKID